MTGELRMLAAVPRVADPARSAEAAWCVTRWCDEFDFDGILLFTGAGAVLDPWVGAAAIISASRRLVPMVAVNPLYTHPFAAARSIMSIGQLHGRRVSLNLITGTALSELRSVGDTLEHGERYVRLREYVELLLRLLDGEPVTWRGRFYRAADLQLAPAVAPELRPWLYLAGASDDARRTAEALGATLMGMFPPALRDVPEGLGAVNVGIIARETPDEADAAAREYFPEEQEPLGREMLRLTMANTDSVWKQRLFKTERADADPAVRMDPFHSFQAGCPYLVGSYDTVVAQLAEVAREGVHTFVLTTPTTRVEYEHLAVVMQRLRSRPPHRQ
ncbi:LLM class flavin-dependent oxidoreductase [Actinomadura fulvescens]|uniref:LLM class flavin-dependent oxidoreductase n=1 Tax=Actinomadura fulvescens TaxID=46160 RepID=A0ABN3QUN9_9ACTN